MAPWHLRQYRYEDTYSIKQPNHVLYRIVDPFSTSDVAKNKTISLNCTFSRNIYRSDWFSLIKLNNSAIRWVIFLVRLSISPLDSDCPHEPKNLYSHILSIESIVIPFRDPFEGDTTLFRPPEHDRARPLLTGTVLFWVWFVVDFVIGTSILALI